MFICDFFYPRRFLLHRHFASHSICKSGSTPLCSRNIIRLYPRAAALQLLKHPKYVCSFTATFISWLQFPLRFFTHASFCFWEISQFRDKQTTGTMLQQMMQKRKVLYTYSKCKHPSLFRLLVKPTWTDIQVSKNGTSRIVVHFIFPTLSQEVLGVVRRESWRWRKWAICKDSVHGTKRGWERLTDIHFRRVRVY